MSEADIDDFLEAIQAAENAAQEVAINTGRSTGAAWAVRNMLRELERGKRSECVDQYLAGAERRWLSRYPDNPAVDGAPTTGSHS